MAKKEKEAKERPQWHHEKLPLEDLYRLQHNPRRPTEKGRKDLKKSVDKFGLAMPIVINMDHVVIGGHQRLDELSQAGDTHADCWVSDRQLDPAQVDELCIRLNKNIAGEWDGDLLAEHFSKRDLEDFGFEDRELAELDGINMNTLGDDGMSGSEGGEDETDPRLQGMATVSRPGDLFELRSADGLVHRVLCGSCTDAAEVKRLFGERTADMVCADPPYGVKYEGGTGMTIQNDGLSQAEYNDFFYDFIKAVPVSDYNTWYLFMSGQELHTLRISFERAGGYWSDYLLWVKQQFVLGRKDYNAQHEFIMYGWVGKHEFHGEMTSKTLFDYDQDPSELEVDELVRQVREFKEHFSTIIRHDRPSKNPYHPTTKPVELIGRLLRDGSEPRDIVNDGFLGSGTTLLACEKYNRNCYGTELDPFYFDVVVGRWCKWMLENERGYELVHLQDSMGNPPAEPMTAGHFLQALEDRLVVAPQADTAA
jgi:DNA modification methylase